VSRSPTRVSAEAPERDSACAPISAILADYFHDELEQARLVGSVGYYARVLTQATLPQSKTPRTPAFPTSPPRASPSTRPGSPSSSWPASSSPGPRGCAWKGISPGPSPSACATRCSTPQGWSSVLHDAPRCALRRAGRGPQSSWPPSADCRPGDSSPERLQRSVQTPRQPRGRPRPSDRPPTGRRAHRRSPPPHRTRATPGSPANRALTATDPAPPSSARAYCTDRASNSLRQTQGASHRHDSNAAAYAPSLVASWPVGCWCSPARVSPSSGAPA